MELSAQEKSGAIILSPNERIDQNSASDFQTSLMDQVKQVGGGTLIIDMSGVEFMSSVGLRALMMAFKTLKPAGGTLLIAGLTPVVKEVFQISRFDTVLSCHEDVETALGSLS